MGGVHQRTASVRERKALFVFLSLTFAACWIISVVKRSFHFIRLFAEDFVRPFLAPFNCLTTKLIDGDPGDGGEGGDKNHLEGFKSLFVIVKLANRAVELRNEIFHGFFP